MSRAKSKLKKKPEPTKIYVYATWPYPKRPGREGQRPKKGADQLVCHFRWRVMDDPFESKASFGLKVVQHQADAGIKAQLVNNHGLDAEDYEFDISHTNAPWTKRHRA